MEIREQNENNQMIRLLQATNQILQKELNENFNYISNMIQQGQTTNEIIQKISQILKVDKIFENYQKQFAQKLLTTQTLIQQMRQKYHIENVYSQMIDQNRIQLTHKERDKAELQLKHLGYFDQNYHRIKVCDKNLKHFPIIQKNIKQINSLVKIRKNIEQQTTIDKKVEQIQNVTEQSYEKMDIDQLSTITSEQKDYLKIYSYYLLKIDNEESKFKELQQKYQNYQQIFKVLSKQYKKLQKSCIVKAQSTKIKAINLNKRFSHSLIQQQHASEIEQISTIKFEIGKSLENIL